MPTLGDLAIVNRTTETAPKDYTVPGAQDVHALAVTAAIDGSGAAGSYLPCLQLLSPAGDVLWTARTASSFAAGQSVDVSWFARAGGITSSVSAGVTPDWGEYFNGGATVTPTGQLAGKWFFNTGTQLLTIPGVGSPTFNARGVYTVTCWVQSSDGWTADAVGGGFLSFGNPTTFEARATGTADHAGVLQTFEVTLTAQVDAGEPVELEFANFDTANRTLYSNQILVQQVYAF